MFLLFFTYNFIHVHNPKEQHFIVMLRGHESPSQVKCENKERQINVEREKKIL